MAELVTLTTPVAAPTLTTYAVRMVSMDMDVPAVVIRLRGSNGDVKTVVYNGPTATTLMVALNKANLATTSLQRRCLERLIADGELPAGTISGTPD